MYVITKDVPSLNFQSTAGTRFGCISILNPNYPTESRSGKKFHSTYVLMIVVLLFN